MVQSPTGTQLINQNAFSDGGFTLPAAGTYTLVVYGSLAATGNYSFALEDVAAAAIVPLGTTVSGTLNPGLSDAFYQFAGKAGQVLYFQALGSNNNGRWDLYFDPTDPSEVNGAGLTSDFEVTLPPPALTCSRSPASNPRTRRSTLASRSSSPRRRRNRSPSAPPPQSTSPNPARRPRYTFLGSVGQRVLYNALQASTPGLFATLESPSGVTVFEASASTNAGPFTLAEQGTYTLTISGSGSSTGTSAFSLLDVASATPLELATSTSGTLTPGLSEALFSFSGSAGQRLSFQAQSLPGASGTWTLFGPEDQNIAEGPGLASTFTANLPIAGTYVLVIAGTSASSPVNYQFTVTDISQTPVAPSGFNTVQSGTIATAGETVPFTFSAPAGLPIYFDGEDATGSLTAIFTDPSGNVVFQANPAVDAGPYFLTSSGNYTLTLSGTSPSATGTFQFQLLDLRDGSTPLELNTPTSGTLSPGTAAVSYSLTVPVGQRVVYNALTTASSGVDVFMDSAGGARVFNSDANVSSGPYTLLAGSYNLIFVGTQTASSPYSFQLLNANAAPALPIDMGAVTGTLNPGVATTLYSVSAVKGEQIYLHPTKLARPGTWTLYGSGNQAIANIGLDSDLTATFPTTGTYLLALWGASTTGPISYSFIAHDGQHGVRADPHRGHGQRPDDLHLQRIQRSHERDRPAGPRDRLHVRHKRQPALEDSGCGRGGRNNLVTTYTYDAHGLVTQEVDPAGRVTDYVYDADERLIKVTTASGTPDQANVEYTYDAAGNILTTTSALTTRRPTPTT